MAAGTRQHYSAEFKADAVRQVQSSDQPVAEVARDLDINPRTLRGWVAAAERSASGASAAAAGAAAALTGEERAALHAELDARQSAFDALRAEADELRAEADELRAEVEALRAGNAALTQQLEAGQRPRSADEYRLRRR